MCNRLFSTVSAVLFAVLLTLNVSTVEAKEYKKAAPAAEAQPAADSPAPEKAEPAQSVPVEDNRYKLWKNDYELVDREFSDLIGNLMEALQFHQQDGAMRREDLAVRLLQGVKALNKENAELKKQIISLPHLLVYILGGCVIGFLFALVLKRKPKGMPRVTPRSGTAAGVILLLAITCTHSLSAATLSPYYAEQGSDKVSVKLCGLTKADKVEFVSPTGKTASTDVTAEVDGKSGACVGLKLSVDDKAETGKYSVLVDGKAVPGAIYIVPDNASVEAARAGGATSGGADSLARLGIQLMFKSVCDGGKCEGMNGDQLWKLFTAPQKGTSERAMNAFLAAQKAGTVNSVFADDRFTKAVDAVNALNGAVQAGGQQGEVPSNLQPVIDRLTKNERDVADLKGGFDQITATISADQQTVLGLAREHNKTRKLSEDTANLALQHTKSNAKINGSECTVILDMRNLGQQVNLTIPKTCGGK